MTSMKTEMMLTVILLKMSMDKSTTGTLLLLEIGIKTQRNITSLKKKYI